MPSQIHVGKPMSTFKVAPMVSPQEVHLRVRHRSSGYDIRTRHVRIPEGNSENFKEKRTGHTNAVRGELVRSARSLLR